MQHLTVLSFENPLMSLWYAFGPGRLKAPGIRSPSSSLI